MRVDKNAVWQAIFAKLERFKEEKRVGSVAFDEANNVIEFFFSESSNQTRYWIPFDELKSYEGQLRWIYHVRGKGWFSVEVLNDFLDVLEYLGLRPPT